MPEPTFPFELTLAQALDIAGLVNAGLAELEQYLPSCAQRLAGVHDSIVAQATQHARSMPAEAQHAFRAQNDQILAELRDAERGPR